MGPLEIRDSAGNALFAVAALPGDGFVARVNLLDLARGIQMAADLPARDAVALANFLLDAAEAAGTDPDGTA